MSQIHRIAIGGAGVAVEPDLAGWQGRFDELARRHDVPGASLAVLAGGEVTALATGVLHLGTGVATTTDSVFQLGSVSKPYTATVLMRLIEQGQAEVDTPVADILPGFRVADPAVGPRLTVTHLLSHTSGLNGDFFHDTGRGDDCLDRYVTACADLPQLHPVGATMSYCNTGYSVAGRMIEALTGSVWDAALREHLLDPLGLAHTWTLAEDVLRFRAAMGHLTPPDGGSPQPAPRWNMLMRSAGPAGLICGTATDMVNFARLHLDGGRAPDGTRLLAATTVAEMQRPQTTVPNPLGTAHQWGLGWALYDWDGRRVYGHDGDTIGQTASLRIVPDADVAVAVLANSDRAGPLHRAVHAELLDELCGLAVPPPPEPLAEPPAIDPSRHAGTYERVAYRIEATVRDGALVLRTGWTDELLPGVPPEEMTMVPITGDLLLGRPPQATRWFPYFFYTLPDGTAYVHDGSRATPKVS
jgi:CubicO group peptidase (beta-lactamase class C family)